MKNIETFKKAYLKLQENAILTCNIEGEKDNVPKNKRKYEEYIADAEGDANTQEVVGYYLVNCSDNQTPYEHWHENTDYLFEQGIATKQDKEVELILKKICNL